MKIKTFHEFKVVWLTSLQFYGFKKKTKQTNKQCLNHKKWFHAMNSCHYSLLWLNWLSLVDVPVKSQALSLSAHLCTATLLWHLNENHIMLSHPLTGSSGSRALTTVQQTPHPHLLNYLRPFPSSYNLILVLFLRFNHIEPPPTPPLLGVAHWISLGSQLAPTAATR